MRAFLYQETSKTRSQGRPSLFNSDTLSPIFSLRRPRPPRRSVGPPLLWQPLLSICLTDRFIVGHNFAIRDSMPWGHRPRVRRTSGGPRVQAGTVYLRHGLYGYAKVRVSPAPLAPDVFGRGGAPDPQRESTWNQSILSRFLSCWHSGTLGAGAQREGVPRRRRSFARKRG
jgi:hypothetical protein